MTEQNRSSSIQAIYQFKQYVELDSRWNEFSLYFEAKLPSTLESLTITLKTLFHISHKNALIILTESIYHKGFQLLKLSVFFLLLKFEYDIFSKLVNTPFNVEN